jgi:hypothetical protein
MTRKKVHRPGLPKSAEPPADLAAVAASIAHPSVTRSGLTTTADGDWALMVRVKSGTATPIRAIEQACSGHPVIYEDERQEPPVARPAYPDRGE